MKIILFTIILIYIMFIPEVNNCYYILYYVGTYIYYGFGIKLKTLSIKYSSSKRVLPWLYLLLDMEISV